MDTQERAFLLYNAREFLAMARRQITTAAQDSGGFENEAAGIVVLINEAHDASLSLSENILANPDANSPEGDPLNAPNLRRWARVGVFLDANPLPRVDIARKRKNGTFRQKTYTVDKITQSSTNRLNQLLFDRTWPYTTRLNYSQICWTDDISL